MFTSWFVAALCCSCFVVRGWVSLHLTGENKNHLYKSIACSKYMLQGKHTVTH